MAKTPEKEGGGIPPSAADRTLELFELPPPPPDRVKTRPLEEDIDAPLIQWIGTDISDKNTSCRLAKYKNGHRAIQTIRRDKHNKIYATSSMLLSTTQYRELVKAVFSDSRLIKELLLRHPEGTHKTCDEIRDMLKIT